MPKGQIFVLSAPSGTGKTTIARYLVKEIPDLALSISLTTRVPRAGEVDGQDYHFVSRKQFQKLIKKKAFAEWANVFGNYYGTLRCFIQDNIEKGRPVLLNIDIQGGLQIKKLYRAAKLIGLLPPSRKEQEKRLRQRADLSEEEIRRRLEETRKERQTLLEHYDVRFINRNLKTTCARIKKFILSHINR